jgi:hypothetical protein
MTYDEAEAQIGDRGQMTFDLCPWILDSKSSRGFLIHASLGIFDLRIDSKRDIIDDVA